MQNFSRGDFCPVAWQLQGLATSTVLNIKSYTLDTLALQIDVSNTGLGGERGRLSGLGDNQGTVTASLDLDSPVYKLPIALQAGFRGFCGFFIDAVHFFTLPCNVEKLHYQQSVEKEIEYSFDVKGNAIVGLFVLPAL